MEILQKQLWLFRRKKKSHRLFRKAIVAGQRAETLLFVHYPSTEDPKVFLHVLKALHEAVEKSIVAAIVSNARKPVAKDLNVALSTFTRRYIHLKDIIVLFKDIDHLLALYKESPLCFCREGKFIICNDALEMQVVDEQKMKVYVKKVKQFLSKIEEEIING